MGGLPGGMLIGFPGRSIGPSKGPIDAVQRSIGGHIRVPVGPTT